MYNKLFSKILDSSIWLESAPTRLVWLTFIAVMDEDGFVQFAAPANVAHRARVTLDEALEALRVLESPDPNSSNPTHLGRRIERVPGGWLVLNAKAHREMATRAIQREQTAERVRRHRERQRRNADVTHRDEKLTPSYTEAVSESDTESESKDLPTVLPARAREDFLSRVPNATAWRARFDGWLVGAGWHKGEALHPDDLEIGLSDYLLNEAAPDFGPQHVRRYVERAEHARATRESDHATPSNGRRKLASGEQTGLTALTVARAINAQGASHD